MGSKDQPDIVREIYFARLDVQGNVVAGPLRVTHGYPAPAYNPSLVWDGSGFGLAGDANSGARVVDFVRLDTQGNELSPETLICSDCEESSLAWTGSEYGEVSAATSLT